MIAVPSYSDGTNIKPFEAVSLRQNQKIILTKASVNEDEQAEAKINDANIFKMGNEGDIYHVCKRLQRAASHEFYPKVWLMAHRLPGEAVANSFIQVHYHAGLQFL